MEQFFRKIEEDDNLSDGFNEMIQVAESDQQADVNFLAKNYYQYWTRLKFVKDEALDDHLFMWNKFMEDPFMQPVRQSHWTELYERFYPITCFLFLSFFNCLTQEGFELRWEECDERIYRYLVLFVLPIKI